jgi:hypothetical protein
MKKNPILTENQARILRQMIPTFEKKLIDLESEIPMVQTEVQGYQNRIKDSNTVLEKAKRLHTRSQKTIASLDDVDSDHYGVDLQFSEDTKTVAYSAHKAYSKLQVTDRQLTEIQNSHLEIARSALEKASREIIQAQEDIEVNQYLLFCRGEYLSSLVDLRSETENQMGYLKDLVGARRRMPRELWLHVFEERVKEDENVYIDGDRHGNPPFSVLHLSWVCQEWRELVLSQPSLWRYIAIPHVKELSPKQKDRLNFFTQNLKHHPATAYICYQDDTIRENDPYLANLLKAYTSFKHLELYISAENYNSERFLKKVQPHIEYLVLFGPFDVNTAATEASLAYISIQNVQNILCYRVLPNIEGDKKPLNLKSLHLTQSELDNAHLVTFIRESYTNTVYLEIDPPFTIYGTPVDVDTTLPNLTTFKANLTVLVTLFNDHVNVPNLWNLTIQHESTMTGVDTLQHWASFVTTHRRKDTISTLGMSGLPLVEASEAPDLYQQMISHMVNMDHLALEGAVVVPALQGMIAANDIPSKLVELTISKSDDVTSEHISTFMETFRTTRHKQLSLRIDECPCLAAKFPQPMILNSNILENTEHT